MRFLHPCHASQRQQAYYFVRGNIFRSPGSSFIISSPPILHPSPRSHRPPTLCTSTALHRGFMSFFFPPPPRAFAGALNWRTLGLFGVRMDAYSRRSWWLINHTSAPPLQHHTILCISFLAKKSYQPPEDSSQEMIFFWVFKVRKNWEHVLQ